MTRENKLALVIGFGLLLFVGILISDHFSVARSQVAADLRPTDDPLNRVRDENPDLLNIGVRRPAAVPASLDGRAGGEAGGSISPVPRSEVAAEQMPDLHSDVPLVDLSEGVMTSTPSSEAIHVLAKGESLTAVCRTYFGDPSLVKKLAAYNGIEDPNKVRQGQSLRIPHAEMLGVAPRVPEFQVQADAPPVHAAPPKANQGATGKTYTVQDGDILSEIARKTLGSGRKWYTLYKFNESIIDDPDRLPVGAVLRIPPQ